MASVDQEKGMRSRGPCAATVDQEDVSGRVPADRPVVVEDRGQGM